MSALIPFHFDRDGLIPVVTQDAESGEVLMLAFMNEQAFRRTQETGLVHYWSRSRNALWLKGETSGNKQNVVSIHVNCERNSLLLRVMQEGAVCHDGFDTCFYRSLRPDGTLHVERDRVFDPKLVYGIEQEASNGARDPIRSHFEAYEFLRDHNLTDVSSTSRLMREHDHATRRRVGDELAELAAVLAGKHVHQDRKNDIILESSQVIYWVYVAALGTGLTWQQIRPDVALAPPTEDGTKVVLQSLLEQYVSRWYSTADQHKLDGALAFATLSLIAQVCHAEHIDPLSVVEYDLRELRGRSYLGEYFTSSAAS